MRHLLPPSDALVNLTAAQVPAPAPAPAAAAAAAAPPPRHRRYHNTTDEQRAQIIMQHSLGRNPLRISRELNIPYTHH